ncbi:hypothetical protein [Marinobacterium iners]|uniref:Uncharacterized protein n=1 Tax=Marinobacterium iners DSM 11526 TaxID=1122198 RepID=A0A1H4CTH5_9GAMM|nr:hypothetical protein [Marinobacterium iners]SEA63730.1 hypothetical protein SAMN02745729_105144 [Marinobacterium iners DSM 11526]
MKIRKFSVVVTCIMIPAMSYAQDFDFANFSKAVERAHELGTACQDSVDADEMTPQCEKFLNYYNGEYDEQVVLLSEEMSRNGARFIDDIGYDEFDRVYELNGQVERMEIFAYDLKYN